MLNGMVILSIVKTELKSHISIMKHFGKMNTGIIFT